MCTNLWRHCRPIVAAALAIPLLFALSACGTMSSLGGGGDDDGASTGIASFTKKRADPMDRPTRVGWTSARASRCGFVFDPARLRGSYLAFERSYGADPRRMQEIQKAYDYSLEATAELAKQNTGYCTRERVDEIRPELNRYLSGNFRTL